MFFNRSLLPIATAALLLNACDSGSIDLSPAEQQATSGAEQTSLPISSSGANSTPMDNQGAAPTDSVVATDQSTGSVETEALAVDAEPTTAEPDATTGGPAITTEPTTDSDGADTGEAALSPEAARCLNDEPFASVGTYSGTMTESTNPESRCEYEVTLSIDEPAYYHDRFKICVQLATYAAHGTQLIGGDWDCPNVDAQATSIFWPMREQYLTPAQGQTVLSESVRYPIEGFGNYLHLHNVISPPTRTDSGLRNTTPPLLSLEFFLDETGEIVHRRYDGALQRIDATR